MKMRVASRSVWVLSSLLVLAAGCGPKEPAPPAGGGTTAEKPAEQPAEKPTEQPAEKPTEQPAEKPAEQPAEKPAEAPKDTNVYLVWAEGPEGLATAWLAPDGDSSKIEATRKQAMVFANDTLFGLDSDYVAFREVSCQDFERSEDVGVKPRPGPRRHLPYQVARGLAGKRAGQTEALSEKRSAYFDASEDPNAEATMIGEHWNRSQSVVGSWRDAVFVIDCEGAYGCGAHGDYGCGFKLKALGPEVPTPDLAKVAEAIAADAKGMIAKWKGDDEDEDIHPELDHYKLLANKGELLIDYVYVASVPYSGTDGNWSSYTQSRSYQGKPVDGMALGELPERVRRYLADQGLTGHFGWSVVKADMVEETRKAFLDESTLPKPAPEDEKAVEEGAIGEADALVNKGRKATRQKKYGEAIALFDRALTLVPSHARALSGRGYARLLTEQLALAKSDFEMALGLDEDKKFQAAIYYNLGEIAEKDKDTTSALAHYRKALALNPTDAARKRIETLTK